MPYSVGEYYRNLQFWQGLTDNGVKHLVHVSNDLPIDRFAGLMHVHMVLWHKTKWLSVLVLIGRMSLNLYTTSVMASKSLPNLWAAHRGMHNHTLGDAVDLHHGEVHNYTTVALGFEDLKICNPHFNLNSVHQDHCVHTPISRLRATDIICLLEFGTLLGCYIITALSGLWYILGPAGSKLGGSIASRSPLLFFIVPKVAAKVSGISFLQLLNFGRFKSLFISGEGSYWYAWVAESFCLKEASYVKGEKDDSDVQPENDDEFDYKQEVEDPDVWHTWHYLHMLGGVVLCFFLIMLSFQAMLIKLTFVSFAALTSWDSWCLADWLVAWGFVNQMAGLCWLEEVEMHRVLLFKFGGSDAKWCWKECRMNVTYFRFLAMRITGGKVGQNDGSKQTIYGRAAALACMYTLCADDIQKLLLSSERESRLDNEREARVEFFKECFADDDDSNKHFMEALQKFKADKEKVPKVEKKDRLAALQPALIKRLLHFDNFVARKTGYADSHLPDNFKDHINVAKMAIEHGWYLEESMRDNDVQTGGSRRRNSFVATKHNADWEVSSSDSNAESADNGATDQESLLSEATSDTESLLSASRQANGRQANGRRAGRQVGLLEAAGP